MREGSEKHKGGVILLSFSSPPSASSMVRPLVPQSRGCTLACCSGPGAVYTRCVSSSAPKALDGGDEPRPREHMLQLGGARLRRRRSFPPSFPQ